MWDFQIKCGKISVNDYVDCCLIAFSLLSVIRLVFEIFMFGADMVWCFVSFQNYWETESWLFCLFCSNVFMHIFSLTMVCYLFMEYVGYMI